MEAKEGLKMTHMTKENLIELYKTTLEQARHHDTINMQAFVGIGVIIPVFLTAIGFLFSTDSVLASAFVTKVVKYALLFLAVGIAYLFVNFTCREDEAMRRCRKVCEGIEGELQRLNNTAKGPDGKDGSKESHELLIGAQLNKNVHPWRRDWRKEGKKRFWISSVLAIIVLVGLGFLLFCGLAP